MGQVLSFVMDPLDVLFFRDGRSFGPGQRGRGGLPLPQTLAGAIRTRLWEGLGIDFGKLRERLHSGATPIDAARQSLDPPHAWAAAISVRGPWLARTGTDKPADVFVAAPADLARRGKKSDSGEIIRLRPVVPAPSFWPPQAGAEVPLWHNESQPIERATGWLDTQGLKTFLDGGVPQKLVKDHELFGWENRTGIAVDPEKNCAEDHMLYSVRLLRLKPGVCLYAEVELPEGGAPDVAARALAGVMPLGGEGRKVELRACRPHEWPKTNKEGRGSLALLVTPGIFRNADPRLPDASGWSEVLTAAVPGAVAVSGWDLSRGKPKPVCQAIMAGSVYYYGARKSAEGQWIKLCKNQEDCALGYGLALKGAW